MQDIKEAKRAKLRAWYGDAIAQIRDRGFEYCPFHICDKSDCVRLHSTHEEKDQPNEPE